MLQQLKCFFLRVRKYLLHSCGYRRVEERLEWVIFVRAGVNGLWQNDCKKESPLLDERRANLIAWRAVGDMCTIGGDALIYNVRTKVCRDLQHPEEFRPGEGRPIYVGYQEDLVEAASIWQ